MSTGTDHATTTGDIAGQTLLILGATGDLAERLLLPGLGALLASGRVRDLSLVGSATDDWDDERWRRRVAESFAAADAGGSEADTTVRAAGYVRADVTSDRDLAALLERCGSRPVVYFALPPAVTVAVCRAMASIDLPAGTRLVMEKPFGTDAGSAEALNELVLDLVPEDHVHRVDHFLGLSTVLNLVGVRFANRIFEPVLNADHVDGVDIVWDEHVGLEGRAGYYDAAGALVDMIQSHLLQVLSIFTMDPPSTLGPRDFRDAGGRVLRATRVWDDPAASSRRARYTAGEIAGRHVPSYVAEDGIPSDSMTETLAEVTFAVDVWRWAGVPFRLRSGKALGDPRKELVVHFKAPPWIPTGLSGNHRPDRLRIGLGPGADRLRLDINVNGPGDPMVLDTVTLQAGIGAGDLTEYGQVLEGILRGDETLSVRGDTAVECWRIVEPVLRAWREGRAPLEEYPAGSGGPAGWPSTDPTVVAD